MIKAKMKKKRLSTGGKKTTEKDPKQRTLTAICYNKIRKV